MDNMQKAMGSNNYSISVKERLFWRLSKDKIKTYICLYLFKRVKREEDNWQILKNNLKTKIPYRIKFHHF